MQTIEEYKAYTKQLEGEVGKYRQYVVNKEKLLVDIIGGMRYDYKW